VGLIQRAIEAEGISTISISLSRTITEKVKPPRALLVAFPLGHPMGNPFDIKIQRQVLMDGLKSLKEIEKPGTIVDLTRTCGTKGGGCIFGSIKDEGICQP
jgi:D-proline reductase (dithiol) PrdB